MGGALPILNYIINQHGTLNQQKFTFLPEKLIILHNPATDQIA